jgi:hypothetical protein
MGDAGLMTRGTTGRRPRSWSRAITGLLAGGLVALAAALLLGWAVADRTGSPGPGPSTLVWHVAAAIAAVLAQREVDRRPGLGGAVAMAAVVVITVVVLAAQWLA